MKSIINFKELYAEDKTTIDLFIDGARVPIEYFVGRRVAVLGKTGSGKTVTGARLAEGLIQGGLQLLIFDSEGDYTTLTKVSRVRVKVFKEGLDDDKIGFIVRAMIEYPLSVVVNLRSAFPKERDRIMMSFMSKLWNEIDSQSLKVGVVVYIDEAHQIIPQSRPSNMALLMLTEQIAKQGRKRGVGLVILSQRPSEVQKNVLSQCDYKFLHRVDSPNDIDAFSEMLNFRGRSNAENRELVQDEIMKLAKGQCYYQYPTNKPGDKGFRLVRIKMRDSKHPGRTPGTEVLYPL